MEKKRYNKPEVKNTKIDFSITLTQNSNSTPPPNSVITTPPTGGGFLNPLNWLR